MDGVKTIIYPVKDIAQAKAVYTTLLGVEPYTDSPYYVGYKVGGQDIGLDPNGHNSGMTGPLPYWNVDSIAETIQRLQAAGAQVAQEPRNVGGGRQIAVVKDADGNSIGLIQDS